MIHGHGGNIYEIAGRLNCRPSEILDMSSNIQGLSDRFIRIALKTPADNRLLASSLLTIGSGSETQADGSNKLRVAC
jgi:hypothetical protein